MTLKEHLESVGIHRGSDRGFTVRIEGTGTDMMVSRRYLEGGFQDVLNGEIVDSWYDSFLGTVFVVRMD